MFQYSKIKNITPIGEQVVYDISVAEDASYLAQGFVNHNSKEPNLQNIPARTKKGDPDFVDVFKRIKKFFIAPEGYTLVQADFKQAELRIIASVANDPTMIAAYNSGIDMHTVTAARIANMTLEKFLEQPKDFRSEYRTIAKSANFGYVYGATIDTYIQYVFDQTGEKISKETAQDHRDAIFVTYPELTVWHEKAKKTIRKYGYIRTLFGRKRRLPEIYSDSDSVVGAAERAGINCLSDDTQILTSKGWQFVDELEEGQDVFTVNPETSLVEYKPLQKINTYQIDNEELIKIESNAMSSISTKNHRWLVDRKCRGGVRKLFIDSDNLSNWGDDRIWLSGEKGDFTGTGEWTDDEVSLIGWIITDGHYRRHKSGSFYCAGISQCKIENIPEIDNLSHKVGCTKKRISKNGQHFWHFPKEFSLRIYEALPLKTITMEFLLTLSTHQLGLLFNSMLKGDGCHDKRDGSCDLFCAGSKERADAFAMLCVLLGKSCSVQSRDFSVYKPKKYASMDNIPKAGVCWFTKIRRRNRVYASIGKEKINYTGRVWCPTVENGTWIAKRNNRIFVTGNSRIQGTSGEWTVFALMILDNLLSDDIFFFNNVHDAGYFYIPTHKLAFTIKIIRELASYPPLKEYFDMADVAVPMELDFEVSTKSWGNVEPFIE